MGVSEGATGIGWMAGVIGEFEILIFLYLTCLGLDCKSPLTPGKAKNIKHTYFTQNSAVAKTPRLTGDGGERPLDEPGWTKYNDLYNLLLKRPN